MPSSAQPAATAVDGNTAGGTSLDALTLPLTLGGQHLFAVEGNFGADGASTAEVAALLAGSQFDNGSHQAILAIDVLTGDQRLFFGVERATDTNSSLQGVELKVAAWVGLDVPGTPLWAENFLLQTGVGL